MKIAMSAALVCTVLLSQQVAAMPATAQDPIDQDSEQETAIGFGSGLVLGAVVGGPVGAIVGAFSGSLGIDTAVATNQD